jgi:hypothetical protein
MDVEENTDLKVDVEKLKNKILIYNEKLIKNINYLNKNFTRNSSPIEQKYENLSDAYVSEYASKNSKFIQYSNSYFLRLYETKPSIQKQAKEKWATFKICENILDIKGKVNNILTAQFI